MNKEGCEKMVQLRDVIEDGIIEFRHYKSCHNKKSCERCKGVIGFIRRGKALDEYR